MNKDQINGRARKAKGKIKEVIGKSVGNQSLEVKGKVQKIAGDIQTRVGDAREDGKKSRQLHSLKVAR